jgi:hypothetical protein
MSSTANRLSRSQSGGNYKGLMGKNKTPPRKKPGRGAYVDEQGIKWDTNDPDLEDWFTKKSRWIGIRRRRYLILKRNKIFFSKSDTEPPHGVIDLVDTIAVEEITRDDLPEDQKGLMFQIVNRDETFELIAETPEMLHTWIDMIKTKIVPY